MKGIIKINCKGTSEVPLKQLLDFQGDLKKLDNENYKKLRALIIKEGFLIPVFTWQNNILDGHQRIYTIKKMIREGYKLSQPDIPVVEIQAKDRQHAKRILLHISSNYGEMSPDSLIKYLESNDLDIEKELNQASLPDIDPESILHRVKDPDPDDLPDPEQEIKKKPKKSARAGMMIKVGKFKTYVRDKRLLSRYLSLENKLLNSKPDKIELFINEIEYIGVKVFK